MSTYRFNPLRASLIPLAFFVALTLSFAAFPRQQAAPAITLHLTVETTNGQALSDLRPSDLELRADGRLQTISSLHLTARGSADAEPLVVVFDLLNLDDLSRESVRSELVRLLRQTSDPAHIYLYLIKRDGTVCPVHALPPSTTDAWPAQSEQIIQQALKDANEVLPFQMRESSYRIDITFAALNKIGDLLSPIPGHKSMVWISHGVRADLAAEKVCTELDRKNISVYTVHQMAEPGLTPNASDLLSDVSQWTGGLAFESGNLQQAVAQARKDAASSYSLEFTVPGQSPDGKFHKIRVSPLRRDVRVRAETGYWAFASH